MKLAALLALAIAFALPTAASAHLVAHPANDQRSTIHRSQIENLKHARYVCNHGAGAHKRWSCKAVVWLTREARETRPIVALSVPEIIRAVFGAHGDAAVSVAACETGGSFNTNAQNGQYLGLFQMGSYARSRYGHGSDAWTQARAAYAYFRDSGWSPWQCLPGGGLRW